MPRSPHYILLFILSCALPLHVVAADKPANSAAGSAANNKTPEKAYLIQQKHYFLGRWQVELNNDRVRTTNLGENYSIVTMAPTWKVVFYRDDSHKSYETTMTKFLQTGLTVSHGYVSEGELKDAKKGDVVYKGLPTRMYFFERSPLHLGARPAWTLTELAKESPVAHSKYYVAPFISTNIPICHFMQKLFTVQMAAGYPIAFVDTRVDKTSNAVLDILSCKVRAPADLPIEYPENYKLCKAENEVTLTPDKRDGINEWARSLGK